jgi:hypothetical protein
MLETKMHIVTSEKIIYEIENTKESSSWGFTLRAFQLVKNKKVKWKVKCNFVKVKNEKSKKRKTKNEKNKKI